MTDDALGDEDYRVLAGFRAALRSFTRFSEQAAEQAGLMPQQHQALLIIRASADAGVSVGDLAEKLMLRPHSATGLIDRLARLGLVMRATSALDRRRTVLTLTPKAGDLLQSLSACHRQELRRLRPYLVELLDRLG